MLRSWAAHVWEKKAGKGGKLLPRKVFEKSSRPKVKMNGGHNILCIVYAPLEKPPPFLGLEIIAFA